jgi:hypothetical protein
MSEHRFKEGDIVRVIDYDGLTHNLWYWTGDIGKIENYLSSGNVYVDFNNMGNKKVYKGGFWSVWEPYLELVEPESLPMSMRPIPIQDPFEAELARILLE